MRIQKGRTWKGILAVGVLCGLLAAPQAALALTFDIQASTEIQQNAQMMQAIQNACSTWSSTLADDVTVTIDLALESGSVLGSGTLGQASSTLLGFSYDYAKSLIAVQDSGSVAEAAVLPYLPTSVPTKLPDYISCRDNLVIASVANWLALGVAPSTFDAYSDPSIKFNRDFNWDLDNSDGVTAGYMDFESVMLHEIGHVLGFSSAVDQADRLMDQVNPGHPGEVYLTTLDLFRFDPNDIPADLSTFDFTNTARNLIPDGEHVLYTGDSLIAMSTGAVNGDGDQASHWKDSMSLGVMDPTLAAGEIAQLSQGDLVAMDLIGWEVVPEPATLGLLASGLGAIVLRRRRRTA